MEYIRGAAAFRRGVVAACGFCGVWGSGVESLFDRLCFGSDQGQEPDICPLCRILLLQLAPRVLLGSSSSSSQPHLTAIDRFSCYVLLVPLVAQETSRGTTGGRSTAPPATPGTRLGWPWQSATFGTVPASCPTLLGRYTCVSLERPLMLGPARVFLFFGPFAARLVWCSGCLVSAFCFELVLVLLIFWVDFVRRVM